MNIGRGKFLLMLSELEMDIIQQALFQYRGPYSSDQQSRLIQVEHDRIAKLISVAEKLGEQIRESLMDAYHSGDME